MSFSLVDYKNLNSKQKENYNFLQVGAILAQYGFNCIRLSDDWNGADFIAHHVNQTDVLKVQLKGRFVLDKKYEGKDIHICFMSGDDLFLYPHDELLDFALKINDFSKKGGRSWPALPEKIRNYLVDKKYLLKRKR